MSYTYILKGNRFYIGSTKDLKRRLKEHRSGSCHSTKRIGNWKLVYQKKFNTIEEARKHELEIKKSCHPERWIENIY